MDRLGGSRLINDAVKPKQAVFSLNSVLRTIYPLKLLHLNFELVLRPPIESTEVIGNVGSGANVKNASVQIRYN